MREFSGKNLAELLQMQASVCPDRIAFTHWLDGETREATRTYAELDQRARSIGGLLQNKSEPGQRVLLLFPPGLDFISSLFGTFYAGLIAVPLYPPDPTRVQQTLPGFLNTLQDAKPNIILTDTTIFSFKELLCQLAPVLNELDWINTGSIDGGFSSQAKFAHLNTNEPAFLLYTSGSIGKPKGVVLSHGNILHNLENINALINARFTGDPAKEIGVNWLPPYHVTGLLLGILLPIFTGSKTILMSPLDILARPLRWLQAISRFQAIISGGPNFVYDLCVQKITEQEKSNLDLSHWNFAVVGSEPIRADTLKRFAKAFAPCGFDIKSFVSAYGLTETGIVTASMDGTPQEILHVTSPGKSVSSELAGSTLMGCGRIFKGTQLMIVDPESGQPCSENQVGEIWISGPSVGQGYWNLPQETQDAFQAKLSVDPGATFFKTGDLGLLRGGELFITGRKKEMIIIRGMNFYPHDIEEVVAESHPGLKSNGGAAFGVEIDGNEQLVMVQEVSTRDPVEIQAILGKTRQAISEYFKIRVHAVLLVEFDSLPRTVTQKIQRQLCRTGFLEHSLKTVGKWPSASQGLMGEEKLPPDLKDLKGTIQGKETEIKHWLIHKLAEYAKIAPEEIDVAKPFSFYGLDSVGAIHLSSELSSFLNTNLAPTIFWEFFNIAELAQHSANQSASAETTSPLEIKPQSKLEPIAIVGMACRFPGAKDLESFWELLREKKDAITEIPPDRWDVNALYDPNPGTPGKMATRWGGFINDIDKFDEGFFEIPALLATRLDPRQRLLLQTTWDALEDAGEVPIKNPDRRGGVFIGVGGNEYIQLQGTHLEMVDAFFNLSASNSIIANILTHFLNLRGPSLVVDTACSASLVAIHLACQSLWNEECRYALAGGVNVILSPTVAISYSKAGGMAPDGRCKAFDASANGFVRSEGVGMVVLKPLSKAQKDGDRIYALIRGSASNTDGLRNGLMAPNPQTQEALYREVYPKAGIAPNQVQYVEAHGTGTSLGDPIEAKALGAVFSQGRPGHRPCYLGSVKTNIGHTEGVGGIAGLIKVALSLWHGTLPASLHFKNPNPLIPFQELGLKVPQETIPWPKEPGEIALAGVSAFGFGGTNAHVVLQEAPQDEAGSKQMPPMAGPYPVALSARSSEGLRALARSYRDWLDKQGPELSLTDLSFTSCLRRTHREFRAAFMIHSREDFKNQIEDYLKGKDFQTLPSSPSASKDIPQTVFVFTGQGPHWSLSPALLKHEPVFREVLEQCDFLWRRHGGGTSLVQELTKDLSHSRLHLAPIGQPALFAVQNALAALWRSWGIRPHAVVGHSVGEITAAHVAGILSLKDALEIVCQRSRLHQNVAGQGKMLAVELPEQKARRTIQKYEKTVSLAALNSPSSCVLSGDPKALLKIKQELTGQDVFCKLLDVDYAYHSHQLDPYQEELVQALGGIETKRESIPFFSTVTGQRKSGQELTAEYWGRNFRDPVLFATAIQNLAESNHTIFLELGAHPLLGHSIRQVLHGSNKNGLALASLKNGVDPRQTLLRSLGTLWSRGAEVPWEKAIPAGGRLISLPHYPWQTKRFWFGDKIKKEQPKQGENYLYEQRWKPSPVHPQKGLNTKINQGTWLIFNDSGRVGRDLARLLTQNNEAAVLVDPGVKYKKLAKGRFALKPGSPQDIIRLLKDQFPVERNPCKGIVFLWSLNGTPAEKTNDRSLQSALKLGCLQVIRLLQAIGQSGSKQSPKLFLVTRGTQFPEASSKPGSLDYSPLWGLARAITAEFSELQCTMVDLDAKNTNKIPQWLFQELHADDGEDRVAFHKNTRYVLRLKALADNDRGAEQGDKPLLNPDGTYLITGGLGGIGLALAEHLVRQGAKHLALMGRRKPSGDAMNTLKALKREGVEVAVVQADVAKRKPLAAAFKKLQASMPPLRGVFHAAATWHDDLLINLNQEDFNTVMAPKVQGSWNLHALTQALPLDFFILFSSAASNFSSPMQGNYAAANAFLDALARFRCAKGLPALSIQFGPWEGVGYAARTGLIKQIENRGFRGMSPSLTLGLLNDMLYCDRAEITVASVNWDKVFTLEKIFRVKQHGKRSPFFSEIETSTPKPNPKVQYVRGSDGLTREKLLSIKPERRLPAVVKYLQTKLGRIGGVPMASLNPKIPILDLGLDSLIAVEVTYQIREDLGVVGSLDLVMQGLSIEDLVQHFLKEEGEMVSPISGYQAFAPALGPARASKRQLSF